MSGSLINAGSQFRFRASIKTMMIVATCMAALISSHRSIQAESTFVANWADEMFSDARHDFGFVARGAETKHRVTIKNIYKQDVHISNIRTSCGCTAGSVNKNLIKSLETAELEINIDTKRFLGEKNTTVFITFDAPLYAEVQFPIHVYIRSDIVLTPGSADFGRIAKGEGVSKEINLDYAGRSDWQLEGIENNNPMIEANYQKLSQVGGTSKYKLQIGLSPETPVGMFRGQVFLKTNDAKNPSVPLMVQAMVESDIVVTPSVVDFGMLKPGEQRQVSVVIRGKKDFMIEKIQCESEHEWFKFKPTGGQAKAHVLPLTITSPVEAGSLSEEFKVTIAGRNEPVSFRATGKVIGN